MTSAVAQPLSDDRDDAATTGCRSVETMQDTAETTASGRWVVASLVVAYLALGMPGMDHSNGEMRDMEHPTGQSTTGAEP